ncbi:class I SAM-dependent methyltransferase [Dongia soli]|uniref:Class I SAM-dependent methyltransferase n=1 Tax=Dongia soli TaxID=600628 RepID=A0ABU5E6W3_9PROT|nr:class I SAM-dependent methyltransferase [Dongia soli]MDY0882030.1 class I SAM-dependent methyltransferase [Dongia soli]
MSRLDSFIRRMQAQRSCLNHAAELVRELPGHVLEFGLGNGRTYDHLRGLLPERNIYVFDRQINAHPDCVPPGDRMFLGDFQETLPQAVAQLGATAVLLHADCGTGDDAANRVLADALTPSFVKLAKSGAVLIADRAINAGEFEPLPLPADVSAGRYFMYRRV